MPERSEILQRQYAARFSKSAEYRKNVWKILCSDFFSRYVSKNSKILDLGAGWGEFINAIPAAEKYAMDLKVKASPIKVSILAFLVASVPVIIGLPLMP